MLRNIIEMIPQNILNNMKILPEKYIQLVYDICNIIENKYLKIIYDNLQPITAYNSLKNWIFTE